MEQVYRRSVEVAERLVRLGVRVEVTMNRRGAASDGSLGAEVIVNTSLGTTLTALESLDPLLDSPLLFRCHNPLAQLSQGKEDEA